MKSDLKDVQEGLSYGKNNGQNTQRETQQKHDGVRKRDGEGSSRKSIKVDRSDVTRSLVLI